MAVRYVVELVVEGDGPVEQQLTEHITAIKAEHGEHSSAYHEIMAHIAMVAARHEWRLADMYLGYERKRDQRLRRAQVKDEMARVERQNAAAQGVDDKADQDQQDEADQNPDQGPQPGRDRS